MYHLLLATGDSWLSPKCTIPSGTLSLFQPAVRAGVGRLGNTDWYLRMLPGDLLGAAAFECHHGAPREIGGLLMATCYLAWTEHAAKAMWRQALHNAPLVYPVVQQPALPWLASAITPMALALNSQELLFQLSDLERCTGWAILEDAATKEIL